MSMIQRFLFILFVGFFTFSIFETRLCLAQQESKKTPEQIVAQASEKLADAEKAFHQGDFIAALSLFQEVRKLDPKNALAPLRIGTILFHFKDYTNAEQAFLVSFELAKALVKQKDEAFQKVKAEVSIDTVKNPELNIEDTSKFKNSQSDYKEALSLKTTSEHFLGKVYLFTNQTEKAKKYIDSVIEQNEKLELKERHWQVYWDGARVNIALAKKVLEKPDEELTAFDFEESLKFSQRAKIHFDNGVTLIYAFQKETLLQGSRKVSLGLYFVAYSQFLQSELEVIAKFQKLHPNFGVLDTPKGIFDINEVITSDSQTSWQLLDQAETLDRREPQIYIAKIELLFKATPNSTNEKKIQDTLAKLKTLAKRLRRRPKKEKTQAMIYFIEGLNALAEGKFTAVEFKIAQLKELENIVKSSDYLENSGLKGSVELRGTKQTETLEFIQRIQEKLKTLRDKR